MKLLFIFKVFVSKAYKQYWNNRVSRNGATKTARSAISFFDMPAGSVVST